jgi:tRNA dimethylallyltransferase
MAPDVIAIFGPTGLGKTAIAIELAEILRDRGESPVAVSVDSMQVYRELPILTGVATFEEQQQLEHRLVGHVSVMENYDVARHAKLAHAEIDALREQGFTPIVVGGTGLYLRAALTELDLLPPPDPGVRERYESIIELDGPEALHRELAELDPEVAATIKPTDPRRILRAFEALDKGVSASDREENRLWTEETRVPTRLFALVMDREQLYERIESRVDAMVAAGAEEEVRAADPFAAKTARQALGFDELLEQDVARMKTNTRRYAKRQLTWLRKLPDAVQIDVTDRSDPDVAAEIAKAVTD